MTKIAMMIDLETLSTAVDAVVVSGGWVIFDREAADYTELSASQMKLIFQDQILNGRRIDESTIRWHIANPTDTFKGLTFSYLQDMLNVISTDLHTLGVTEVWSNGANFDISILEHIRDNNKLLGPPLWKYNQSRCFRTIKNLFPDCKEENPLAHNALEDARDQAKELWRITQKYFMVKE